MLLVLQLNNLLEEEATGSPPTLVANIPNIAKPEDTGTYEFDLSVYFTGATSYAIDPAVETGWDFNTSTGVLTIDTDDTSTFGPYTVTASNDDGDTDSNAFSVYVVVPAAGSGGSNIGQYWRRKRRWR